MRQPHYIIPNIIPVEDSHVTRKSKKVWRACFFGRLEERKGLVGGMLLSSF